MKYLLSLILLALFLPVCGQAPYIDSATLSLNLDQVSQLHLHNVNGSIKVVGSDQGTARLTYVRTLKGLNSSELAKAKSEVQVDKFLTENHLFLYLKAPNLSFQPKINPSSDQNNPLEYQYSNCGEGKPLGYDYHFDFVLYVPRNTELDVSTLNQGTIEASNLNAPIYASNLNGPIYLSQVAQSPKVYSLNGDIEVERTALPENDEHYSTLNGHIKLTYPANLAAEVTMQTHHGELFTDFEWTRLSPQVEKVTESKRKTFFKINSKNRIQIRDGGPTIHMKTMNGDLYLLH